jgi:hypothetical protein
MQKLSPFECRALRRHPCEEQLRVIALLGVVPEFLEGWSFFHSWVQLVEVIEENDLGVGVGHHKLIPKRHTCLSQQRINILKVEWLHNVDG